MLDIIQAIGTAFILLFTGLTFWYEVLRTPHSDVGIEFIQRDEPYSTTSGNITFHGPPVQFNNMGEMDAILEEKEFCGELLNSSSEPIELPESGRFEVSFRNKSQTIVPSGSSMQLQPKIDIHGLPDFPDIFYIRIRFDGKIRDNKGTEEINASTKFQFVNE